MQIEFKITAKKHPSQARIDSLIDYLFSRGERWTTARQIAADTGLEERTIRDCAEHSNCQVVSGPGCPGYRHIMHTTADQIREIVNRLQSQAKRMQRRSISIGRAAHKIIR